MDEEENFFSDNHNRLLNIAYSAKIIAWTVFIVYIIYGLGTYYVEQTNQLYSLGLPNSYIFFTQMLTKNPVYALSLLAEIIGIFLRGTIYFLMLKAISLGLNMIVETDINYRDARKEGDAK